MKKLLAFKAHLLILSLVLIALSTNAQQSDTIKRTVVVEIDTVVKGAKPNVNKVATEKTVEVVTTENVKVQPVFYRGLLVVEGGIMYKDNVLPVLFAGEFGLARNIGLEARTWYGKNGIYEDGFLGVGLNYHFSGEDNQKPSKFDPYVGGIYGKVLDGSGTAFYAQAGGRLFLFKNLGAFANLNVGLVGKRGTNLSFGLSYKIH